MVQVVFPGLAKRLELREHASWHATARYLTWRTGKDWSEADVDRLVESGELALDEDGWILTSSVEGWFAMGSEEQLTSEDVTILVREFRESVNRVSNLMVRLTDQVMMLTARDRLPVRCPHARQPRKRGS